MRERLRQSFRSFLGRTRIAANSCSSKMVSRSLPMLALMAVAAAMMVGFCSPSVSAYHLRFNFTLESAGFYDYFALGGNYVEATLISRSSRSAVVDVPNISLTSTSKPAVVRFIGMHSQVPTASGGYDMWTLELSRPSTSTFAVAYSAWYSLSNVTQINCMPYVEAPLCEWTKLSCSWSGQSTTSTMLANVC